MHVKALLSSFGGFLEVGLLRGFFLAKQAGHGRRGGGL